MFERCQEELRQAPGETAGAVPAESAQQQTVETIGAEETGSSQQPMRGADTSAAAGDSVNGAAHDEIVAEHGQEGNILCTL